jgi:predicted TIM-barrel fold metal-dependent hydrolase
MSKFGFHVIDADGHGGEPADWFERLPDAFKPQWQERTQRIKQHFANLPGVGVMKTQGTARVDMSKRAGMTDPVARLADMDLEGIDQVICFPGGAGEEWAALDRDFAMALCRTLNDARAEFMRHDPDRLKTVAKLPMIDPAAAVAELRRCVGEHGMVGMVTPSHVREKNLDDPSFGVVMTGPSTEEVRHVVEQVVSQVQGSMPSSLTLAARIAQGQPGMSADALLSA